MILAALAPALAGVFAGATAARDIPSSTSVVGLDLRLLADPVTGARPHGRLLLGPDVQDGSPVGLAELGFVVVVPSQEQAVVRLGLTGRLMRIQRPFDVPFQREGVPDGTSRAGLVPAVLAVAELMWTPEAPAVLGLQVGMGPWSGVAPACVFADDLVPGCIEWPLSYTGSLFARKTFPVGLTLHAAAGVHLEVGVGWTFGQARRGSAPVGALPEP